jgi:hypothetical protein
LYRFLHILRRFGEFVDNVIGGYNHAVTAKVWTKMTAHAMQLELDDDIPENSFFSDYGPDFRLDFGPSTGRDENTRENLDEIASTIQQRLNDQFNYDYSKIVMVF